MHKVSKKRSKWQRKSYRSNKVILTIEALHTVLAAKWVGFEKQAGACWQCFTWGQLSAAWHTRPTMTCCCASVACDSTQVCQSGDAAASMNDSSSGNTWSYDRSTSLGHENIRHIMIPPGTGRSGSVHSTQNYKPWLHSHSSRYGSVWICTHHTELQALVT